MLTASDLSSVQSLLPYASVEEMRRLRRIIAQDSPAGFAATASRGRWILARHLELLNQKLLDVALGRTRRLIISMPPRHGKSEATSKYFPAWYLGRFPDRRIILASYESDFAASWGRKVRDLIDTHGPEFFGVKVRADSSAANRWDLDSHEGGMVTAGVGGPIVGRGANILVLDDPIKNAEESNSPVIRQRHRDWWRSTAYTRLEPDGAAIVMCTRWNEEDLPGWLIAEVSTGDGEPWDVLNLPALAEENDPLGRAPGEALWPERFSVERLNEIHKSLGSYWFAALYQQRPAPISGGMFHIGEIAIVDALPVGCRMVRYWDKAGTAGGGAFSAGVLMARAADGRFYIADIVRGQWSAGEREKTIKQTAELDGRHVTVWMEQEPGSGGKESAESTIRNLAGWNVHAEPVTGDKETRARPFAAQVEAGNVAMLRKPWNKAFIDEAALFPFGKYKDQIDAAAGGFNKLAPVPSQGPAIVGGKRDAAKLVIR
jgi:predicted phage terminase large subunit-like protein